MYYTLSACYHVSERVHLEVVAVFAGGCLKIMVCNEDRVLDVGPQALALFLFGGVASSCTRKVALERKEDNRTTCGKLNLCTLP